MTKKIITYLAIVICLLLSSCATKSNTINTTSNTDSIESTASESKASGNIDNSFNYKLENIFQKASIEDLVVNNNSISFKIRNTTDDNELLSAYLEYVRLKDGKEYTSYRLDLDKLNIPAGHISDTMHFNPQKPLGSAGVVRIKALIFKDSKDDYIR